MNPRQKLMMACTQCDARKPGIKKHCGFLTVPYTGGAATKGRDKLWRWQFFIDGNQRAMGTDPHLTAKKAEADFNEVMTYTIPESPDVSDS